MKLLQLATFTAVILSNIRHHWTPNPYLAGLIGVFASWVVTVVLFELRRLLARLRGHLRQRSLPEHLRGVEPHW
jgi:hypothetical protein